MSSISNSPIHQLRHGSTCHLLTKKLFIKYRPGIISIALHKRCCMVNVDNKLWVFFVSYFMNSTLHFQHSHVSNISTKWQYRHVTSMVSISMTFNLHFKWFLCIYVHSEYSCKACIPLPYQPYTCVLCGVYLWGFSFPPLNVQWYLENSVLKFHQTFEKKKK